MQSKWFRMFFLFQLVFLLCIASVSADIVKFETKDLYNKEVGGYLSNGNWISAPTDLQYWEISYTGIFYVEQIVPGSNWVGYSNLAYWARVVDWDITLNAKGGHGGGYNAPQPGGWGFDNDLSFHYTRTNSFMRNGNLPTDYWPLQVLNAGNYYPGYEYYLAAMPLIYPDGSENAVAIGASVPGSVLHVAGDIWLTEPGPSGHMVVLRGPYVNVPTQTPEPATILLFGLGLLGLAGIRSKFKR